jgi:hypothetical protein
MGLLVPKPHTFRDSHVLIYSLNTRPLILHKNDVIWDYNFEMAHMKLLYLLRAEYIAATLNANLRKAIHIIAIYIPSTLSLSMFIIHLQKFLDLMPISCPTIIIDDFNINMYDHNSTQPNELQSFMDQWNFNF